MSSQVPDVFHAGGGGATFATTHWSVVLLAAGEPSPQAEAALGKLYQSYAYPLYSYIRRQGYAPEAAEDSVQEIFLALLEKHQLASVSPEKGRFRSYLLAAANHLLANEWQRRHRQKRGTGQPLLELDGLPVEERYRLEPADERTPEKLFERRWALALLDRVLHCLEEEWRTAGKGGSFEALRVFLSGDQEAPSYAEAGQRLGLSEGAARVAVHRLRQRYRDLLRAEIAQTVGDEHEIEDELRHLLAALRS